VPLPRLAFSCLPGRRFSVTMRLGHDLLQFGRAHHLRQLLNSAPRPPLFPFPPARSVRFSRNSRSNPAAVSLVCESPRWNRHRRAEGVSFNYTICTFLSSADTHYGALARCFASDNGVRTPLGPQTRMSVFLKVAAGRILRIRGAIPALLQCIHERASLWMQSSRDRSGRCRSGGKIL